MSLFGRDGEERSIKASDISGHEVAALRIEGATTFGIGVIERFDVEPVLRPSSMCVATLGDHLPELVWIGGIAWEPASHADDGNRHGAIVRNAGGCVGLIVASHDAI